MLWALILTALWSLPAARAHHVLCIFPVASPSHDLLGKGIVDALLDAGHKVTWATPYPKKAERENLKLIDVSATTEISNALDMTDVRNRDAGPWLVKEFSRNISRVAARAPALREALVRERFDAVVTEWFFNDVDAGYAAVQQVPWILLSGVPMHPRLEMLVDTVRSLPTNPVMINDSPFPMNLWQRIVNTAVAAIMGADMWLSHSSNAAFYEETYAPLAAARGVSLPPFSAALHNVSILLVNSHPSVVVPQTLPPNVIEIGGYHIDQNPPPLPKDLQDLLDSSPQGVVYFSMGSVIKSASLPEGTQRALLQVFGGIRQTVLWKFERELKNVPKNVHVRAWMPQASILAHPNVKLFITHGGLLSTLEAAQHGVPMLTIPVFGDQPSNAARSVRAGVARRVAFSPEMAPDVKAELEEMLATDGYYKKAKAVSRLFRDRPIPPGKLISYYVNLAIDSKGAHHLRSPTAQYSWYELLMLDQIMVFLLAVYLTWCLLKIACSFVKNILFRSGKEKTS